MLGFDGFGTGNINGNRVTICSRKYYVQTIKNKNNFLYVNLSTVFSI